MSDFTLKQVQSIAEFNPSEQLKKGVLAKCVPMAKLKEFQRKITGYELKPFSGGAKFRNGDILVAKITPCLENGKTAFVDILADNEIAFGSTEFIVLRARNDTNPEFLYYFAISPDFRKRAIECMEGTSGRKRVNENTLKTLELPIPNLKTQKSIAHILSTLDQKIAINNQINAQLEQMAKTLYDYWFVQFDFPDENGKPYKSSGGEMVYNDTLKREIPKGWEAQKISHWLQSDKSGDWGKEIQEGNYTLQVNCIRGADINAVNFQGNIEAPIRFILPKNKHKLLSPFNLVVEISGGSPTQSTGRLALISDYVLNRFDFPVICSNFCKAISLKNTDYFYQFVFMWNAIYKNDILFGWEGKTSGIKNLLFENFTEGYFECYPPLDLAKKFFEIADVFHKQQQFLLKQNQQLTQLRDFLLPMLMNGQVGVGDD